MVGSALCSLRVPCSLVCVVALASCFALGPQGFTKIGYSMGILHVEADLNQGTTCTFYGLLVLS